MKTLERTISLTLRTGVVLAAMIAGVGGLTYLMVHGSEPASFSAPTVGQSVGASEQIIALGVLVLIATPVARVALLAVAFARQRDPLYAGLSVLVLTVLLVSLV